MSIFIIFLSFLGRQTRVNRVDPHQATRGSVLSGSVLFVILSASSGQIFEPRHEKTNVLVSDLFRHKPGCTATEDG